MDRLRTPPKPQSIAYKWLVADQWRTTPNPQPLAYKRLLADRRRTPPKPQPRGLDALAAVLSRSFHSLPAVLTSSCFALATAPLSPTAPQPHTSPASRFALSERSPRPSHALLAACRPLGGARHHTADRWLRIGTSITRRTEESAQKTVIDRFRRPACARRPCRPRSGTARRSRPRRGRRPRPSLRGATTRPRRGST